MSEKIRILNKSLYRINEAYFLNEQKKKISDAELCIMYVLDDGLPHSQIEISREWFIPKTTVNTVIGHWIDKGYVRAAAIPGKRRERNITFTERGKAYSGEYLPAIYKAEEQAMRETAKRYSDSFVEAIEYYASCLEKAFRGSDYTAGKDG